MLNYSSVKSKASFQLMTGTIEKKAYIENLVMQSNHFITGQISLRSQNEKQIKNKKKAHVIMILAHM